MKKGLILDMDGVVVDSELVCVKNSGYQDGNQ